MGRDDQAGSDGVAMAQGLRIGIYPDNDPAPRAHTISWEHALALRDTLRTFAAQDRLPPQAFPGVRNAIRAQLGGDYPDIDAEVDDWFLVAVQQLTDEPPTMEWISRRLLS